MNLFHKATNKTLLLLILLGISATGCSTSKPSVKTTIAREEIPATSLVTQNQKKQAQPSQSQKPQGNRAGQGTATTVSGGSSMSSDQSQLGPSPAATTVPPQIAPSTLPRFESFTCTVTVNDTTQQPTPTTRAIRIDVDVSSANLSSVATAVTTSGITKRLLISVNKLGKGYTQVVVPESGISYVSIFASPDFFPDSTMCSAQG
jgi:hypothetical protein